MCGINPTLKPLLFFFCSYFAVHSSALEYSYSYFVLQWPGSFCNTIKPCCFPPTGKPKADFLIHGLWPTYSSGKSPSNCNNNEVYDESKIRDLKESLQENWPDLKCPASDGSLFWSYQFAKHGTCAMPVFDQRSYFNAALTLKNSRSLLDILSKEGIKPRGGRFRVDRIKKAIWGATGFQPFIECNKGKDGEDQLFQIYMCVDQSATMLIRCPKFPSIKRCPEYVKFPAF